MSIAEKVQQLESDRDSLHRSYQGKVDELKYVREQFDKYKADFGNLPREVQRLTADRDQWKARAEAAEDRIADLEREFTQRPSSTLEAVLEECRIAGIETHISVVDRQEFRVRVHKADGGVSRVTYAPNTAAAASAIESIVCSQDFYPASSFARRRSRKGTPIEFTADRTGVIEASIAEADGPIGASSRRTPELTPASAIPSAPWSIVRGNLFNRVMSSTGEIVIRFDDHDMAFYQHIVAAVNAYRPDPTPNHSETPNSSPTQADPVKELLENFPGEWECLTEVSPPQFYDGKMIFMPQTRQTIKGICEIVNRYRRIVEAVNHPIVAKYVSKSPISLEHWNNLRAALRPLLKQEAAK